MRLCSQGMRTGSLLARRHSSHTRTQPYHSQHHQQAVRAQQVQLGRDAEEEAARVRGWQCRKRSPRRRPRRFSASVAAAQPLYSDGGILLETRRLGLPLRFVVA